MISRPVVRGYDDDEKPLVYHVEPSFEVYSRETALALEHLFRHMRALQIVGLYRHPTIERYFGKDSDKTAKLLLTQCHQLLDYCVRMQAASELTQAHLLNELQATIPYLEPAATEPRL